MGNEMDQTTNDSLFAEEGNFDRIPPKQLAIEYNFSVKFVSRSLCFHLDDPSYNFDGRFVFSLYDKMMRFKEQRDCYADNLKEM